MEAFRKLLALGPSLWAWFRIIAILGVLISAWTGVQTELAAQQADLLHLKAELDKAQRERDEMRRTLSDTLSDIRYTIGVLQLDTAQICVATLGIEKCYTAGRPPKKEKTDE